jgi:hypothetical protein
MRGGGIRRLAEYFLFGSSRVTKIDGLTLNTTVGLKSFSILNAAVHSYPSVFPSVTEMVSPCPKGEKWSPTNDVGLPGFKT